MKWIVIILVLLNLSAWLLGQKVDPNALSTVSADQVQTINAAAMTVVLPDPENSQAEQDNVVKLQTLEEDSLAQLKLDKRGQVLRVPEAPNKTPKTAGTSVSRPVPVIVANDLSATASSGPVEPVKLAKIAPVEPDPAAKPESAPKKGAEVALTCYRLGPFNDQNSLAGVRRKLENGSISYSVAEVGGAKRIKGVRVYLGAYPNTAALEAEVKRLKELKVDHFVITLNGTPLIQLGYFSEPTRAKKYQQTLKQRGIEANTDTIYHDARIESWLDVGRASKSQIDSLILPKSAKSERQACR